MPEDSALTLAGSRDVSKGPAELIEDCRALARYAVENDQLPTSIDVEQLFRIRRTFEISREITDADFGALVRAYATLERRLGPVTANTLRATDDDFDSAGKSVAREYVDYLFKRTILIILLVLAGHLVHFWSPVVFTGGSGANVYEQIRLAIDTQPLLAMIGLVCMFLIPFLYGALGADAFLLRETTHKLHTRQFDPRRIPENRARFLLGSLSGGVIVFFVSADLLQSPGSVFNVGGAALGFIAGFSTDFLFDTIDRVINAILPRVGASSRDLPDRRADDELLLRYRHLMDNAQSDDEKKLLKFVVEDLESRARSGG